MDYKLVGCPQVFDAVDCLLIAPTMYKVVLMDNFFLMDRSKDYIVDALITLLMKAQT